MQYSSSGSSAVSETESSRLQTAVNHLLLTVCARRGHENGTKQLHNSWVRAGTVSKIVLFVKPGVVELCHKHQGGQHPTSDVLLHVRTGRRVLSKDERVTFIISSKCHCPTAFYCFYFVSCRLFLSATNIEPLDSNRQHCTDKRGSLQRWQLIWGLAVLHKGQMWDKIAMFVVFFCSQISPLQYMRTA